MAIDTFSTSRPCLVEVVLRRILILGLEIFKPFVRRWLVALDTQVVPRLYGFCVVGVVTICAPHPCLVHSALNEGAVDIHFIQDLPIGMIKPFPQQGRNIIVHKRSSVLEPYPYRMSARVASRAGLDLPTGGLDVHQKSLISVFCPFSVL